MPPTALALLVSSLVASGAAAAAELISIPSAVSGLKYEILVDPFEVSFDDAKARFVSTAGKNPRTALSHAAAKAACASRGMRLPTLQEWAAAAAGTPDAAKDCNASSTDFRAPTAALACRSAVGAYDLVGNAWEMVDFEADVDDAGRLSKVVIDASHEPGFAGAAPAAYDGKTWVGTNKIPLVVIPAWDDTLAFPAVGGPPRAFEDKSLWHAGKGLAIVRGGDHRAGAGAGIHAINFWNANLRPTGSAAIGFRCAATAGRPRLALAQPLAGATFPLDATVELDFTTTPGAGTAVKVQFYHRRDESGGCFNGTLAGWTKLNDQPLGAKEKKLKWQTKGLAGGGGRHYVCGVVTDDAHVARFLYGDIMVGPASTCVMNDGEWTTVPEGCKTTKRGDAEGRVWSRVAAARLWPEAKAHCEALTEDGTKPGSWRLPMIRELAAVSGAAGGGLAHLANAPTADTIIYLGAPKSENFLFWSGESAGAQATAVGLDDGKPRADDLTSYRYAVCVRK